MCAILFEAQSVTYSYFFILFAGSSSTGSTKSANMELYTTSSYNETMSGGETLSSISDKSCISGSQLQQQQQQTTSMSGTGIGAAAAAAGPGSNNSCHNQSNSNGVNPVMINSASLQDYQDAAYMVRSKEIRRAYSYTRIYT